MEQPLTPNPGSRASSIQRQAPFSMHSRGVLLLEKAEVLSFGAQAASALGQVRDVGSAFFTLLLIQTWTSVFTAIMTIISIAFFSYGPSQDEFPLDLSYIGFLIILPCLLTVHQGLSRREAALRDLAAVKAGLLSCWLKTQRAAAASANAAQAETMVAVQETMLSLLDTMRGYFGATRFYSSSYPYFGIRTKMVFIAQERTRQLRRIMACLKKLTSLCEGCEEQLHAVHLAFECMVSVKEFRQPQAIRALIRICVPVVIPVFVGPFWASYYTKTNSFAFSLLVGLLLNLMLVAVLNVAVALEDPFDNVGLDGIYCDEHFYELEQNMLMDADGELAASAPRFSHAHASTVPPSGDAKLSRASAWSTPGRRSPPGGHDTIKSERHPSFVSIDNLPLSTEP